MAFVAVGSYLGSRYIHPLNESIEITRSLRKKAEQKGYFKDLSDLNDSEWASAVLQRAHSSDPRHRSALEETAQASKLDRGIATVSRVAGEAGGKTRQFIDDLGVPSWVGKGAEMVIQEASECKIAIVSELIRERIKPFACIAEVIATARIGKRTSFQETESTVAVTPSTPSSARSTKGWGAESTGTNFASHPNPIKEPPTPLPPAATSVPEGRSVLDRLVELEGSRRDTLAEMFRNLHDAPRTELAQPPQENLTDKLARALVMQNIAHKGGNPFAEMDSINNQRPELAPPPPDTLLDKSSEDGDEDQESKSQKFFRKRR